MAINYMPDECGGLIKQKESSWVKLKAFPTNVGWPNNKTESIQHSGNSFRRIQTTNPAYISQTCMDSISAEPVLAHSNADT